MDSAESVESPDVIREQIEETRASLADKLETLESEVRSSVDDASETVKHSMEEMKKVFRPTHWIEKRPWTAFGASLAAGVAIAAFTNRSRREESTQWRRWSPEMKSGLNGSGLHLKPDPNFPDTVNSSSREDTTNGMRTKATNVLSRFGPEIESLKHLAIGAVVGLAADYAKQAVPEGAKSEVGRILDGVIKKFQDPRL